MKALNNISLADVKAAFGGPEGELRELLMGEHLEIGGMATTREMAARAGITRGMRGVHLFCLNGAAMRVLVRFEGVRRMHGVEPTESLVKRGRLRTEMEGLTSRITFIHAEIADSELPSGEADFVWGEGAWCHVEDKPGLIAEAVRLVRPGGAIAFTDWIEGSRPLTGAEAERFLNFMRIPCIQDLDGYRGLLSGCGCEVEHAADTGRFEPHAGMFLGMLEMQLSYDAHKVLDFDMDALERWKNGLRFMRDLAARGKIAQGMFIARRK
jgi:SAM-dependent methyltransferase